MNPTNISTTAAPERENLLVGLIINPIAGVGGRIGFKGSDDVEAIWAKIEDGEGKKVSNERAMRFLKSIGNLKDTTSFLCFNDEMGESVLVEMGFNYSIIGKIKDKKPSRDDTKKAAKLILEKDADLLIGAVLVVGEKAPHLVSEQDVMQMQRGSVIIDISVDQGGCIETTRPTSYEQPTFVLHGVTHFGVTNMPGSVPATASQALSASLIPFLTALADSPDNLTSALQSGVNIDAGEIVHPALK